VRDLEGQARLPGPARPGDRHQTHGLIVEPSSECLQIRLAAEKRSQRERQREAAQFVGGDAVFPARAGAPQQDVSCRRRKVKCAGERADRLEVGPTPFPAFERADAMDRQAGNGGELFLCVARSLAKCPELLAK